MPHPILVSDCMYRSPLTTSPDTNLVKAISLIVEYKLTGLTVAAEDGSVVGILSELDCIRAVLTAIYNDGDPDHMMVRDAMCTDLNTCAAGDSIVEVAQSMLNSGQRRRPVVEGSKLVGQVSSNNILWALMEHSRAKRFDSKAPR